MELDQNWAALDQGASNTRCDGPDAIGSCSRRRAVSTHIAVRRGSGDIIGVLRLVHDREVKDRVLALGD